MLNLKSGVVSFSEAGSVRGNGGFKITINCAGNYCYNLE